MFIVLYCHVHKRLNMIMKSYFNDRTINVNIKPPSAYTISLPQSLTNRVNVADELHCSAELLLFINEINMVWFLCLLHETLPGIFSNHY